MSVREALAGRHLLLTGATGFVGKVLLERILVALPDTRVTLLVRPGRAPSAAHRMGTLLANHPCFARVPHDVADRVDIWEGDLDALDDAPPGALDADLVIHLASRVDFEPTPAEAWTDNVQGTRQVVRLASRTRGRRLIHTSTCYVAGSGARVVPEVVAPLDTDPSAEGDRLEALSKAVSRRRGKALLAERARELGFANGYTLTKALAEHEVLAASDLHTTLVRPSIVEAAWDDPFRGFHDGFRTCAPLVGLALRGLWCIPARPDLVLDLVPVDRVARGLLLAAAAALRDAPSGQVWQLSSSHDNPLTMDRLCELVELCARAQGAELSPVSRLLGVRPVGHRLTMPGRLSDALGRLAPKLGNRGRPLRRASRDLSRVQRAADLFTPFLLDSDHRFVADRAAAATAALPDAEREVFGFDVADLDWRDWWHDAQFPGLQRFCLNTPPAGAAAAHPRQPASAPGGRMIDTALMHGMARIVDAAALRHAFRPAPRWRPGEPLRLLLAGYNGSRNTGADVRVHELTRQLHHILGPRRVQLSVTTLDPSMTRGLFPGVRQLHLSAGSFPTQLPGLVRERNGVLACEGSMFKSGFANALSAMMAGAMGIALAEGKPAIGVGGEAGRMEPALEGLVRRVCAGGYVLARTRESLEVVERLGRRADRGTDTAWTLETPEGVGAQALSRLGWDGRAPLMVVCPVNPFWWPVRPDPARAMRMQLTGEGSADHARHVYFHRTGPDVARRLDAYLDALAEGARAWDGPVVVVGMEALDRPACGRLAEKLGGAPTLVADEATWPTIVAVLRQASLLVSSRYHAIVCSMPAGVPSIGVSHDERIPNLMNERDTPDLALDVDAPDLAERCVHHVQAIRSDPGRVRQANLRTTRDNLVRMGTMGRLLFEELQRHHPELRGPDTDDPWAYLPPSAVRAQAVAC
jgi:nucleoside-diphosphate-sugar epimerase/polysaccharide pyruvyl transferase WcaK-like protein